jgi:polyhydroxyalkanoate synthesis regulator phasin
MIVIDTLNRVDTRGLQASILLCAIATLSLGAAHAQDYEAVEKRLGKAVSKGELSLQQAVRMMEALEESGDEPEYRAGGDGDEDWIENRLHAVGRRLKAAVKAGTLTEAEAWAKWAEINREYKEEEYKEEDKDDDVDDRGSGIEGHFNRLGASEGVAKRIRHRLRQSGLTEQQAESAMGGLLRIVHGLHSDGEHYELDPRLRHYFEDEIELTDEQIELVLGLSRRVTHSLSDRSDNGRERRQAEE